MLSGELSDSSITMAPMFRITSRHVSMEAKAVDSGVNVKLFTSNPVFQYYFLRFCSVGAKHYITGPLNITAFTFDDSNRAFCSVKLNVHNIRPLAITDEEGNVIPTDATRIRLRDIESLPLTKFKYLVHKYVWENISNDKIVFGNTTEKGTHNLDSFAKALSTMHDALVNKKLIVGGFNPVSTTEKISRPETNAYGRPVPRTTQTVYSYNLEVKRTDWSDPAFTLQNLLNENLPFPVSTF
ncbi:uncharacterized protein EV154DRAFT_607637 [Mucor mucedo]|uniref:uncharacterized protein n=1 Tax=Mucor mucedo TaxID=29922 RepID=UPI00221FCD69|nr:uncharacterized protein EV154DRAFT_607637 [Mucor mucedo]KAI7870077.1 hypothetical protein EV154DRAFT_607637 [Mucor mucedo]